MAPEVDPNINPLIWTAIEKKRLLRFRYKNRERIAERRSVDRQARHIEGRENSGRESCDREKGAEGSRDIEARRVGALALPEREARQNERADEPRGREINDEPRDGQTPADDRARYLHDLAAYASANA